VIRSFNFVRSSDSLAASLEVDPPPATRWYHVKLSRAVVLAHAGSSGPPLRGAGADQPGLSLPSAPFLSVANRPLLQHGLDWLAAAGIRRAVVIVPESLAGEARRAVGPRRRDIAVDWLEQLSGEDFTDTLVAVAGFLEREPFVLHLADSLAKEDLRSLISDAAVDDLGALLLVDEEAAAQPEGVIDLCARFEHGNPRLPLRRGSSAGVAVLGARAWEAAASTLDRPDGGGLERLADKLLELGCGVRTCPVHEWWRFKGGAAGLLEGNRFALEQLRPDFDSAQLVRSDIQGAVVADATARIEASIVRGPAIIGPGAHVREAYVGPYTSIGEGVVIEGAEIEHSVVLAGASISYLGGRLEASVVGRDTKIFRDFRLPRALRVLVGEGANISLA
jgi:glucose-1-phosphate thymidylyltransferase